MCGIALLISFVASKDVAQKVGDEARDLVQDCAERLRRRGPDSLNVVRKQCEDAIFDFVGATLFLRGSPSPQPLSMDGKTLLWNGEIFGGSVKVQSDQNDTAVLMEALSASETPVHVLNKIHGPWSLIFWDEGKKKLWFGRDSLGRRSLLIRQIQGRILLSSVAFGELNIQTDSSAQTQQSGDDEDEDQNGTEDEANKELLQGDKLGRDDWEDIPPGLYCIDFSVDGDHKQIIRFNFEENITVPSVPEADSDLEEIFTSLLSHSVRRRVEHIYENSYNFLHLPKGFPEEDCPQNPRETRAKLGILFSGGLDSSVLAALADKHLPIEEPIDLLNVSFGFTPEQAPDRITGLAAVQELREISNRRWNFIKINIPVDDIAKKFSHVNSLAYPSRTVMDSNISASFWFASRGIGVLDDTDEIVISSARVLLMGIGADEQLAGYGRHQTSFRRGGMERLESELKLEMGRLWRRNLGRDDRVISDLGRECRHPFLDEEFRTFVAQIPLRRKCDLSKPRGTGDKALLRKVARNLGLKKPASAPKRAVQFGSRIAKQYTKTTGDVAIETVQLKMEHVVNLPKKKKPYVRRPPKGTQHPLYAEYYAHTTPPPPLETERIQPPELTDVDLDLDNLNQLGAES